MPERDFETRRQIITFEGFILDHQDFLQREKAQERAQHRMKILKLPWVAHKGTCDSL